MTPAAPRDTTRAMARRYHILDVFSDRPLAGNPLAVVSDAEGLDAAAMQAVAREFNLSETVFLLPPSDAVNMARARIFTPSTELPFAGHPTIGTAVLVATLEAPELLASQEVGLVLEQAIGAVRCTVRHRRGEAAHARFEVPRLAEPWGEPPDVAEVAALLGLAPDEVGWGGHRPTRFSAGVPFTFVPVATVAALGRAKLAPSDEAAWAAFSLFARDGDGPRAVRTRMLARGLGVAEDPGTGSAAAAFAGALLAGERLDDGDHDCRILQGVEMGRPSRIGLAFTVENHRLASTTVGGEAVIVAEGTLRL